MSFRAAFYCIILLAILLGVIRPHIRMRVPFCDYFHFSIVGRAFTINLINLQILSTRYLRVQICHRSLSIGWILYAKLHNLLLYVDPKQAGIFIEI